MRAAMDTLFVRLTALEAMVMQKPIITGRYSASPYINFWQPMEARCGCGFKPLLRFVTLTEA